MELTSLPKKWKIKLPFKEAQAYYDKKTKSTCYSTTYNTGYLHSHNAINESILSDKPPASFHHMEEHKDYITITQDEFRKWVLKESPMKEEEFKVGDWVECIKLQYSFIPIGKKGKVIGPPKGDWVSVSWEDFTKGHNCDILEISNKSGYYIQKENIKLIPSIKEESSIPIEYVESTGVLSGANIKGKIYKVIGNNVDIPNYDYTPNGGGFIKSTKEAFEAQNKPIPSPSIEEDGWCVKFSPEIQEDIVKWSDRMYKGESDTYYGEKPKSPQKYAEMRPWGKLLTTEEFYAKIGKSMPNKKITLIKDRYYSCVHENGSKFFFQFDRLDDDYLYVKAYRQEREKWNEYSSTWIYSKNSQFKEVTESEAKGIIAPVKEENLVGRYLVAVRDRPQATDLKKGECLKITRISSNNEGIGISINNKTWNWDTKTLYNWELMPIGWSPEAKSVNSMSKEELLEEAKRRYPLNTIVNSLVVGYNKCRIKEYGHPSSGKSQIWATGELISQNNRTIGILIYDDSKSPMWAEIVEKAPLIFGTAGEGYTFTQGSGSLHNIFIDPYQKELSISDVFKPKKSAKMSYVAENSQSPRQLSKVVKIKSIQI